MCNYIRPLLSLLSPLRSMFPLYRQILWLPCFLSHCLHHLRHRLPLLLLPIEWTLGPFLLLCLPPPLLLKELTIGLVLRPRLPSLLFYLIIFRIYHQYWIRKFMMWNYWRSRRARSLGWHWLRHATILWIPYHMRIYCIWLSILIWTYLMPLWIMQLILLASKIFRMDLTDSILSVPSFFISTFVNAGRPIIKSLVNKYNESVKDLLFYKARKEKLDMG